MKHKNIKLSKVVMSCLSCQNSLITLILFLSLLASCSSDGPDNFAPGLRTLNATDVTRNTAILHGSISLSGKTAMPTLSFRYGIGTDLSIEQRATANDSGQVSLPVSGLTAGTTYQYQLVSSNGHTALYANTTTFTTDPNVLPTIGTTKILSHGPVSAILGFTIPDNGGEQVTEAGCYVSSGTVSTPSADDKRVKYPVESLMSPDSLLQVLVTGLQTDNTYTFFPYVVSKIGEAVGTGTALTTSDAIMLSAGGDFARLMSNTTSLEKIVVAGPMNGSDISCLESLHSTAIDMTSASIVSGGGPYNESYYTEDNIVGQRMFAGITSLQSIALPDNATTTAKDAFAGCTSLRSVTIPSTAVSVTPSSGCTALQSISVSDANTAFKSVDGVLCDKSVTRIVWFPMGKTGSYTLPSTITSIGSYAFQECSITDFVLPDNITTLGQAAFYNSKVEKVTLPAKLRTLPTATFQGCKDLKTVMIGSDMELISDYAFDGCPLTDIYISATTPPVCNPYAFSTKGADFTKTCILHVPEGCAKYYRNSAWKIFTNIK